MNINIVLNDDEPVVFRLETVMYFQVLCELEIAMMEKGITVKREDPGQGPITRSIMSDAIRDIEDESYRNLRDWYIYR